MQLSRSCFYCVLYVPVFFIIQKLLIMYKINKCNMYVLKVFDFCLQLSISEMDVCSWMFPMWLLGSAYPTL